MVQQDVAPADFGKYLGWVSEVQLAQARVGYGFMGRIAQLWIILHLEGHQVCQTQQALS